MFYPPLLWEFHQTVVICVVIWCLKVTGRMGHGKQVLGGPAAPAELVVRDHPRGRMSRISNPSLPGKVRVGSHGERAAQAMQAAPGAAPPVRLRHVTVGRAAARQPIQMKLLIGEG